MDKLHEQILDAIQAAERGIENGAEPGTAFADLVQEFFVLVDTSDKPEG